jgi:hypothetical protein
MTQRVSTIRMAPPYSPEDLANPDKARSGRTIVARFSVSSHQCGGSNCGVGFFTNTGPQASDEDSRSLGVQVVHRATAPPQPSPVGHGVSVPPHCGRDPRPRDLPVIANELDRNGQRVQDHPSACRGVRQVDGTRRGAGNGAVTGPNGALGPFYAYLGCPVAGGWCSSALILSRCAAARLSYPPVTWWLGSRTRVLGRLRPGCTTRMLSLLHARRSLSIGEHRSGRMDGTRTSPTSLGGSGGNAGTRERKNRLASRSESSTLCPPMCDL